MEKRLTIHRDGKYFLTAKDVACLFDDDATLFAKYWPRALAKVVEAGIPRCRPAALVRIASDELFAFRSTNCRTAPIGYFPELSRQLWVGCVQDSRSNEKKSHGRESGGELPKSCVGSNGSVRFPYR